MEYKRLSVESCIDEGTDCRYHYVYGINDMYNPHCHDFYEIFVTISGLVTHEVNGTIQKLPEGSMVFIRPDDQHGFLYETPESKKTEYINFAFTRETAQLLFDYLSDSCQTEQLLHCDIPPTTSLTKSQKERLSSQISELSSVNWENKDALKLRMRAILVDIFVQFFFQIPNKKEYEMPNWLSKLLLEMEHPDNFAGGMERMIALSEKSREHLSRCIKKYCGLTVAEYINELRLNYASNLLLHTNSGILEICYACGFQSQSYFYKVFKNKYGFSPKAFRKEYKNLRDI